MAKKKVTSSDVARASGVSQATVSMILNHKSTVSFTRETVEKVERTAREMGYQVPGRRTHKDSRSQRMILVVCPTLTNPYYVMLLQGIEEIAKEKGYGVFVCNTQRNLKLEENYLRMMRVMQPQGIIYTCNPSACYKELIREMAEKIPLVVVNNRDEGMTMDAVELNNAKPGRLMAGHLLELGHRHVAFVSPPLTSRQGQRQKRIEGFVKEYEESGLKGDVIVKAAGTELISGIPSMDSEYRMGYLLTEELMETHPELTAIAAMNDMMAFGIMDALLAMRRKIPQDVSVIGCDNIIYAGLKPISLTTIDHFVALKGRDACEIVIKKIHSQRSYRAGHEPVSIYHIEYEPKLIVRSSTTYARTARKNK